MVLRDVQNGSLEKWCESVELECVWKRFCRSGRVDPKTKNDGRHERTNARASFAHDGDKHLDERKHRTRILHSPESQFCQALRRNNGMTAGQKLLECEQMDDGSDGVDGGGFDGFDGLDGFHGT